MDLGHSPENLVAPLDWVNEGDGDDDDGGEVEINAAVKGCEMDVALDIGCVARCAGPKNLPPATEVEQPNGGKLKSFIAADNTPIETYGVAHVVMETADGQDLLKQLTSRATYCNIQIFSPGSCKHSGLATRIPANMRAL